MIQDEPTPSHGPGPAAAASGAPAWPSPPAHPGEGSPQAVLRVLPWPGMELTSEEDECRKALEEALNRLAPFVLRIITVAGLCGRDVEDARSIVQALAEDHAAAAEAIAHLQAVADVVAKLVAVRLVLLVGEGEA